MSMGKILTSYKLNTGLFNDQKNLNDAVDRLLPLFKSNLSDFLSTMSNKGVKAKFASYYGDENNARDFLKGALIKIRGASIGGSTGACTASEICADFSGNVGLTTAETANSIGKGGAEIFRNFSIDLVISSLKTMGKVAQENAKEKKIKFPIEEYNNSIRLLEAQMRSQFADSENKRKDEWVEKYGKSPDYFYKSA
jgi:hypothetical protein